MAIAPAAAYPPVTDGSFCKGQSDIQSGLMVITVAAAVLSLIPPCRFVGVVLLRSVAVVSALDLCQDEWKKTGSDWKKKAIMCAKIAATGLGIAAVVASSPVLLIAAIATDIAVQIFEMMKTSSIAKKLLHFAILAVNITVLTGVILCSWQILLVASVVTFVAMLCLGIYIAYNAKTWKDAVNVACYIALAGTGIASAVIVSRLTGWMQYGERPDGSIVDEKGRYRGGGWEYRYSEEYRRGGFLEPEYYNTLPNVAPIVAAERVE